MQAIKVAIETSISDYKAVSSVLQIEEGKSEHALDKMRTSFKMFFCHRTRF